MKQRRCNDLLRMHGACPAWARAASSVSTASEFARIRSAWTHADSDERCRAYPDAAEFACDPEVIEAFDAYRVRTFKHGSLTWTY